MARFCWLIVLACTWRLSASGPSGIAFCASAVLRGAGYMQLRGSRFEQSSTHMSLHTAKHASSRSPAVNTHTSVAGRITMQSATNSRSKVPFLPPPKVSRPSADTAAVSSNRPNSRTDVCGVQRTRISYCCVSAWSSSRQATLDATFSACGGRHADTYDGQEASKILYHNYLDMLLAEAGRVRSSVWAMRRWPVALPSYRANLGCFNRP
eukprot:1079270-Rhodomonas_salina.1